MSTELSTALTLLAIGMITVFVVLLLVVVTGNLLIRLVNKLPNKEAKGPISSKEIAVLSAAVEIFTQGKGRITKIDKH